MKIYDLAGDRTPVPLNQRQTCYHLMPFILEKHITPFLTIWMDTGSPPQYRTQTYQLVSTFSPTRSLSRNDGLLVSYTNYVTPHQTTSAANLKLHTNLSSNPDIPPVSTSVNPPHSTLVPAALKVLLQSPVFYCWGRPLWFGRNIHFRFVSSLNVLQTNKYGRGTERHLPSTDESVVQPAGEHR